MLTLGENGTIVCLLNLVPRCGFYCDFFSGFSPASRVGVSLSR